VAAEDSSDWEVEEAAELMVTLGVDGVDGVDGKARANPTMVPITTTARIGLRAIAIGDFLCREGAKRKIQPTYAKCEDFHCAEGFYTLPRPLPNALQTV
jgi:hypothetical protein